MTDLATSSRVEAQPRLSWWRRWFIEPIRKQLVQGTSPESLAWATAVGATVGIVPIMGTVSSLTFLVSLVCRFNQVVAHLFSRLLLPAHLALIIPFLQLGQRLWGFEPIDSTIPEMVKQFGSNPMLFVRDFGLVALRGFCAWLIVAPVIALAIRFASAPAYRYFAKKLKLSGEMNL